MNHSLTIPELAEAILDWLKKKGKEIPEEARVKLTIVEADKVEESKIVLEIT